MSKSHKVNTVYNIKYDTAATQSGLSDLRCDFYNPDQINFAHDPLVDFAILVELGTTGIYEGSFTPTTTGSWTLVVGSATANPPISGKTGRLEVESYIDSDRDGVTFDPTTDSQEAIRDAVDGVSANIASISRGGLLM